jgi:hypothetical protein
MITRINNNRGRRFLNPLQVEGQYITEDRATNPDLLLWVDFTDRNSLGNSNSAGVSAPSNGEKIMIAHNKSYNTDGYSHVSAGHKALGAYFAQPTTSKMPVFVDPGDGTPSYALFDEGDFMDCRGTGGVNFSSGSGDFSTSELDLDSFTMYIACERDEPDSSGRQDVLFMTTNDYESSTLSPREWLTFCFTNNNNWRGQYEIYDTDQPAGQNYRRSLYDEGDDKEFHYHMINNYAMYSNNNPDNLYVSLQADGIFHDFTNSIDYNELANGGYSMLGGLQGGLDETFEFTNANLWHPSITIGGQSRLAAGTGAAPRGTFKGKIYEILIFKSEHAGPAVQDYLFYDRDFKRRWSNMLYYFQRKYQYIAVKH